ncbi:MAG: hypothetical protein RPT25_02565 [Cycloclasticus sp.]
MKKNRQEQFKTVVTAGLERMKHSASQLKNQPILVAESDGFVLRAMVIHADSGKAKVEAWAESRAVLPAIAVSEVCAQLLEALGGLPKKGYMIAPGMVSALLELPVEPAKPRPANQMQELIRWEIDPFISEFDDLWNIGAILQGAGYLLAEQRVEIVRELEVRIAEGDRSLQRFGELALAREFISREQLEECLAVQEKLVSRDVNLSCGWALQQWGGEEDLQYTWLVGGMTDLRRKHWYGSFAKAEVRLQSFYSSFTAVVPLLAMQQEIAAERLLLELHQEQIACIRVLDDKTIVSLQVVPRPMDDDDLAAACLTLCMEQMRSGVDKVYLHSALALPAGLIPALVQGLDREVLMLSCSDLDPSELPLPVSECLSLYGLAQSLLAINKKFKPLAIAATEPPPPIWKNLELWRYAVPVLFCLGLIAHLVWSEFQLADIKHQKAELATQSAQKSKLNSVVSKMTGEVGRYTSEMTVKQASLKRVTKKLRLLEGVLIKRKTQVPLLLRALADSINAYVVVEEFVESQDPVGFKLKTWAIHDASAQQFAKQLETNMAKLGYMVADIELNTAKGRTGVNGYGVNILLIEMAGVKSANSASAKPKVKAI